VLQSIIDRYGQLAPIKIMGDFNAQVPHQITNPKWYLQTGYNKHSRILHNFISANDFIPADMHFKQHTRYTYFVIKRNVHTWIDHALSTNYDLDKIKTCNIMPLIDHNVSDHLPIRMVYVLSVPITKSETVSSVQTNNQSSHIACWSNVAQNDMYHDILASRMAEIGRLDLSQTNNTQCEIDNYVTALSNAMFSSAKEAGCVPKKTVL
jgi:hypothetical protein